MDDKSILIIDLGTSKVHVNVIRIADGKLLYNATTAYPWMKTEEKRTEIFSEVIWQAAQSACKKALEEMENTVELEGISFSWFGAELVTMDNKGEEVFPLIVSFDARAEAEAKELKEKISPVTEQMIGRGGLTPEANPAKMLWLKRHAPDRYQRIRYIGTIEQYFYRKLGLPFCAEKSMAQTLQYRKPNGELMEDVIKASEISEKFLDYPIVDGDGILGELTEFGMVRLPKKIPVLYGGHDCILSQLGSGVSPNGNGILGDVSGTYDLMGFLRTERQKERIGGTCVNTPLTDVYSFMYGAPTGAILSERITKLWGKCSGELLTELFRRAHFDGKHGNLWKLPEWENIRQDAEILDTYGEMRVFESLVEEITFELKESYLKVCEKNGGSFSAVRIGGGASGSRSWLQLKADLFHTPVELTENVEVSSMGAAMIAAVALGYYSDYDNAISHMVRVSERYEPRIPETYENLFVQWKEEKLGGMSVYE